MKPVSKRLENASLEMEWFSVLQFSITFHLLFAPFLVVYINLFFSLIEKPVINNNRGGSRLLSLKGLCLPSSSFCLQLQNNARAHRKLICEINVLRENKLSSPCTAVTRKGSKKSYCTAQLLSDLQLRSMMFVSYIDTQESGFFVSICCHRIEFLLLIDLCYDFVPSKYY